MNLIPVSEASRVSNPTLKFPLIFFGLLSQVVLVRATAGLSVSVRKKGKEKHEAKKSPGPILSSGPILSVVMICRVRVRRRRIRRVRGVDRSVRSSHMSASHVSVESSRVASSSEASAVLHHLANCWTCHQDVWNQCSGCLRVQEKQEIPSLLLFFHICTHMYTHSYSYLYSSVQFRSILQGIVVH